MENKTTIISELKPLLVLALPLMLSEFVDASFGFTSTLLAAHLGVIELAAGGLVTTLFVTIMIFMWGILVTVSTLTSQKLGANDHEGISRILKDGLILASIFSIPGMLLVWNMAPILLSFGQKREVVDLAEHYLHALTWAVFADFWAVVLLQFVIGLGRTRIALFFNMIKVPVTLIVSYLFMYGKLGMPKIGLVGLGVGITTGMWFATSLLIIYILCQKNLRQYLLAYPSNKRHYLFEILRTGLPIAAMFCIEVVFFAMMALVMGRIGNTMLAANQIVTQFTFFFTIVISFTFSQAVAVRIGHAVGRHDLSSVLKTTHAGLLITFSAMLLVACAYWFYPQYLIGLDLDPNIHSDNLMHYAVGFMLVAGFVQIFESQRIVLFGALRGLGESRFSMITSLIIFWAIAFPLGIVLTNYTPLGGIGMWLGMAVGTLVGALLLFWGFHRTMSRHPASSI